MSIYSDYVPPLFELESYDPIFTETVSRSLTASASTTVVTATESGVLIHVGICILATISGSPSAWVDVTIDGGSVRSFLLWSGSSVWHLNGARVYATNGDGDAVGDNIILPFGAMRYQTSLLVVSRVASTGTGSFGVSVRRGTKL